MNLPNNPAGRRSADGWTTCDLGHRHWGLAGAAGVLVTHVGDEVRYLLQHRSAEVQHGLTWGVPGGALAHDESPVEGALREAEEEIGGLPAGLSHVRDVVDDHGGWAYTTVVVKTPTMFAVETEQWETGPAGVRWFTAPEVEVLPLHHGFAATWRTGALHPEAPDR